MMKATGLIHAADESRPARGLGRGEPIGKSRFPPRAGGTRTVDANQLPVISYRTVDRRPYLQEPAIGLRKRVGLKIGIGNITRGYDTATGTPRSVHVPPGAKYSGADTGHAANVRVVVEIGTIESNLVLEISTRNAPTLSTCRPA